MKIKTVIAGWLVSWGVFLVPVPVRAVQVELGREVDEQISASDSLQDVFPEIDAALPEGRVPASLVDGRPQPDGNSVPTEGNSVVLDHRDGPVRITWDLGANGEECSRAQLKALTLWLSALNAKKWTATSSIRRILSGSCPCQPMAGSSRSFPEPTPS